MPRFRTVALYATQYSGSLREYSRACQRARLSSLEERTHVAPTASVATPAAGPAAKNRPSVRSLPADATTAMPCVARYSATICVGELLIQLTTLPSETLITSTSSWTARIMPATIWGRVVRVQQDSSLEAALAVEETHEVVARDVVATSDLRSTRSVSLSLAAHRLARARTR